MKRNRLKSTMHRLVVLAMFGAAPLVWSAGSATAQTTSVVAPQSRTISYQGVLQKNGTAVPDGDYTVRLTLYSDASGTTKVWQGTYTVHTQNGVFNVLLGSGAYPFPAPPSMDGALWLGTKIGEGAELPLTPLGASAFAMNVADSSITAKKMATDYVGSISVNGQKVTSPGGNLNLVGTNGIRLNVDPTTQSLYVSGSGSAGTNSGKGAEPQTNVVHAITGTANQVSVDGSYTEAKTDSVTLALPQDIATTSSPTFDDLTLNGLTHYSSPADVSGILAVNASNQVGYRTPAEIFGSAANNWILNQTTPQTANFNITGNGVIGGSLGLRTSSPAGLLANTSSNDVLNSVGENSQSFHWVDAQTGWAAFINNTGTSGSNNGLAIYLADNTSASDALDVVSYYHQLFDVNGAGAVTIGQLGTGVVSATNGLLLAGNISESEVTNLTSDLGTLTTNLNNEITRAETAEGTKLPLAGGTMAGAIDMGTNGITNLANPTNAQDAATKHYVDNASGNANYIQNGTSQQTANFNINGTGTAGHFNSTNDYQIGGSTVLSEAANGLVLANGGNVGIGTSNPLYKLHVVSSGIPNTVLEGSSDVGTWLSLGNTSTGGHWFDIISTGTNNSEGSGKLLFTRANAPNQTAGKILTLDWATSSITAGGTLDMSNHAINNVADPTNAQDAATKGYVDSRAAGVIPIGGIIMWSGSVSNIPAGWALCDGNTYNGHATPNLTGRFIVGASSSYAEGTTGGSAQAHYTASGILTTSSSTTGISVNPAYTGLSLGSYGPYNVDESTSDFGGYLSNVYLNTYIRSDPGHTHSINDPGHTHTVNASGITLSTTSSLPPYYAMAYIMRVQ